MVISFYTYRLLLKELGVEDYGVYAVVGSVVSIFSSLKGLLTSATQRFLNYEMGCGNALRLNQIFSMSVLIHFLICLLFLILVEIVGIWYISTKLVIPPERLSAAYWVFHLSVVSTLVAIMTVPYDSVIIANERMKIFAYISILDGFLKLGIIGVLILTKSDKLIIYSILLLFVAIIIRVVNTIYCRVNFPESKFAFFWEAKLFRQMGSFAGWQFLGNTSFAIQNQGLNMVLNFFFGPTLNAARGIVVQANGALQSFVQNALVAVNPQIVKLYASNKRPELVALFFTISKFSFLLFFFLSFPVFLLSEELLNIWLYTVPEYTIIFLKLTLIYTLIRVFHNPIDSIIKATGKIKIYQIIDSIILLISLPITFYLFKSGYEPYFMFIVLGGVEAINIIIILFLASRLIGFSVLLYFRRVLLPNLFAMLVAIGLYMFFQIFNESEFIIKLLLTASLFFVLLIMCWLVVLTKMEKSYILNLVSKKIKFGK